MKVPEREALRWMLQSEDDCKFAKWVLKEGVFFDKGCFIAQQAGEKALKACLYGLGRRRVFGHSLFEMAEELSGKHPRFKKIIEDAKLLDRYYIPTRYPNGIPGGSPFQLYGKNDLELATKSLEKIMGACQSFLKRLNIIKE
jgi:HEPN domain-containing protein